MYRYEFLIDGEWQRCTSKTGGRYEYDDDEDAETAMNVVLHFAVPMFEADGLRLLVDDEVTQTINLLGVN